MPNYYLKILGSTQDGGYPHSGCYQKCCQEAWKNINQKKLISSIAIIEKHSKKFWLIDITPDFRDQIQIVNDKFNRIIPDGIFNFTFPDSVGTSTDVPNTA